MVKKIAANDVPIVRLCRPTMDSEDVAHSY